MFNALLPQFVVIGILLLILAIFTIGKIRYTHIVSEGYVGLLYHKGKFVRVLAAGRHVHWGRKFTIRWVDVRRASLLVPGQDVLTADNVGLKLSLLATYQVIDSAKAMHDTQNWQADLHNAAQLALRTTVGAVAIEALLNQRLEIGVQLLARVQPEAAMIGVKVLAVEVKDVMFPADLRRAFSDVLKAKQEGQADTGARPRRKRSPAQSRERGSSAGRQSCLDEPASDTVALGCSERGQHSRARRAGLCAVEERQAGFG